MPGDPWKVLLTPRASKQLRRLPAKVQSRILDALAGMESGGPFAGDVRKMEGKGAEWRLRVGDWRVRFGIDFEAREIVVLQVLPRGEDTYRD